MSSILHRRGAAEDSALLCYSDTKGFLRTRPVFWIKETPCEGFCGGRIDNRLTDIVEPFILRLCSEDDVERIVDETLNLFALQMVAVEAWAFEFLDQERVCRGG